MSGAFDQVVNLSRALEFYGYVSAASGLKLIRSGVSLAVFNMAVLEQDVSTAKELQSKIDQAAGYFKTERTPWSFWICQDLVDRSTKNKLHEIFAHAGLNCVADTPGMEIRGIPPLVRPLPELDFQAATDGTVLRDFGTLVSDSFHVPREAVSSLYSNPQSWRSGLQGWVGYHRGLAVTTAVANAYQGVIGLYSIATHTQMRRKGYGEAILRYAMAQAAQESGLDRFVLQSSPSGRTLYKKFGFRKVTDFLVFATT